jgi:hypothetical protein
MVRAAGLLSSRGETKMSTAYEIDIAMASSTVNALVSGNYKLFAFKAVQANVSGSPVVWFSSNTYATTTKVQWTEQYQGYTTNSSAISGGSITASNAYDMDLAQKLVINSTAGTGDVFGGGTENAITIANQSGTPFASGISQVVKNADGSSSSNPMCAFNLYGTTTLQIAPIEQVLLMFATASYNTGAVVYNAFTVGVLVNLTSANQRSVNFDINAGWSWGGASWGQNVQNDAELAPLLIDTPSVSATKTLLARNGAGTGLRRIALVA